MAQVINTKVLPTTNRCGTRMCATSTMGNRVVIPYDFELCDDSNHVAVARALATSLNWHGPWYMGDTTTGRVFVCAGAPILTVAKAP